MLYCSIKGNREHIVLDSFTFFKNGFSFQKKLNLTLAIRMYIRLRTSVSINYRKREASEWNVHNYIIQSNKQEAKICPLIQQEINTKSNYSILTKSRFWATNFVRHNPALAPSLYPTVSILINSNES